MSDTARKVKNPEVVLERLRNKVFGDSSLLLDSLIDEELISMQKMIFKDEAEIVSSACKSFLIAKLERTINSYRRVTAMGKAGGKKKPTREMAG